MRIGFLLPGNYGLAGPGNGVRTQAIAQARALEDIGHSVIRLNPWESRDPRDLDVVQFFFGGYAHHRIEARLSETHRTVFAPVIDSNVPDWMYRFAAACGGLHPKVETLQAVYRRQAMLADAVVCMSEFQRMRVIRGLGVPPRKVSVVLNGVDASPVKPDGDARPRKHLPEDFLLFVGSYASRRKNVKRLIEAVGPTGYPLLIAGRPRERDDDREIRRAAEPYDNVRFLGFLEPAERDALYAACRVFCLPSLHEGTGLAALEAAAQGAPVVITKHGGPPDYFRDMAEYVDPHSVESIREAVERAWDRGREPGSELREHVRENLTWESSARSLEAVYRAL